MAPYAPLPWIAESDTFCAGDRKAMGTWCTQLLAAAKAALQRDGATAEMLADDGYVLWVALDTLIATAGLDRLDTSTTATRVMLKAALAMATETASIDGSIVRPERAAQALSGLQLTAAHGLQLTAAHGLQLGLKGGQSIGRPH